MSGAHALGRQLAHPRGWGGRLLGPIMTLANRRPIALAIKALEPQPGDQVLDVGCGTGDAVARLARTAAHVTGVDRSAVMVGQAQRRNRRAVARGTVVIRDADFGRLPFAPASFDKVLAANVAYFWADPPAAVAELRRVMRSGGRLVVYVTEAETMGGWSFAGPDTHRHYDAIGLFTALVDGGFGRSAVDIRPVALPFGARGLVAVAER